MPRRALLRTLTLPMLAAMLVFTAGPLPAFAQSERSKHNGRGEESRPAFRNDSPQDHRQTQRNGAAPPALSAQEAAARAQAWYGGKVLKVSPEGSAYQVRLLQDDGRVITVTIGD